MENEYRIECEECESVTIVLTEAGENPEFCPCCGRRAEIEELNVDTDM